MKRYISIVCIFVLLFCSCAQRDKASTFDLLCELIAYVGESEENSIFYSSFAELGELGYISDDVRKTLYGEKYVEEYFPLLEEYAICISGRQTCEIAVFKCRSHSDTDAVLQMCLERADVIKVALRGTELEEKARAIRTEIHGRYVLFSFSDRSEALAEYFCELV
ncbi:MAG: hypothetical protein E7642_01805 [Ruminococcaceae bacterium]|nr:hypothetical protein [Oscillospiraceae bacterium]